eukprot:8609-Heterococcus_DN1.PRE.1
MTGGKERPSSLSLASTALMVATSFVAGKRACRAAVQAKLDSIVIADSRTAAKASRNMHVRRSSTLVIAKDSHKHLDHLRAMKAVIESRQASISSSKQAIRMQQCFKLQTRIRPLCT